MTILSGSPRLEISLAALSPSSTGITTSSITISGRSEEVLSSASEPFAASATTSNPPFVSISLSSARKKAESSAIRTLLPALLMIVSSPLH